MARKRNPLGDAKLKVDPKDPACVILPNGCSVKRSSAAMGGYVAEDDEPEPNGQFAIEDPFNPNAVFLPDGTRATTYQALAQGYEYVGYVAWAARLGYSPGAARDEVSAEIKDALKLATFAQKGVAFMGAVMSLPEAQCRPAAASRVCAGYSHIWTVERAQSFLRGLPTEEANGEGTAPANTGHNVRNLDDAKLRRLIEIRINSISMQADSGDRRNAEELRNLKYAMHLVNESKGSTSMQTALAYCSIDPTTYYTIRG